MGLLILLAFVLNSFAPAARASSASEAARVAQINRRLSASAADQRRVSSAIKELSEAYKAHAAQFAYLAARGFESGMLAYRLSAFSPTADRAAALAGLKEIADAMAAFEQSLGAVPMTGLAEAGACSSDQPPCAAHLARAASVIVQAQAAVRRGVEAIASEQGGGAEPGLVGGLAGRSQRVSRPTQAAATARAQTGSPPPPAPRPSRPATGDDPPAPPAGDPPPAPPPAGDSPPAPQPPGGLEKLVWRDDGQTMIVVGADGVRRTQSALEVARLYWTNMHDATTSRQTAYNRGFLLAAADGLIDDTPHGFAAWMIENSKGLTQAHPVVRHYMALARDTQAAYEAALDRPRALQPARLASGEILNVSPSRVTVDMTSRPPNLSCPGDSRPGYIRFDGRSWEYCDVQFPCAAPQRLVYSFHPWQSGSTNPDAGYASTVCITLGPGITLD